MKKITILVLALLLTIHQIIIPISNKTAQAAITTSQMTIEQKADDIIHTAVDLIGKATYNQYVYNTETLEFGCSGFILYVFRQNGIDLNTRNTQFQAELGEYVPKDQLQKGDLVFFDSNPNDEYPVTHDGIYIGDNKIIHMADTTNNVIISDLDSKAYYRDYYVMARRVIPGYMPSENPTVGDKIVDMADRLIGKTQYGSYNETTLTFYNAGFTYYLYQSFGYDLTSKIYAKEQSKLGVYVPKDQLQKGDLVFFSNDANREEVKLVGIYAGNNNVIINASSSTGVVKRYMSTYFYKNNYMTARRIISNNTPQVSKADQIVTMAHSLIGKVNYGYTYDETTLTFNNAGFTYYLYKMNGIDLKYKFASHQSKLGIYVPKDQLQKGDVVFFSKDVSPDKIFLSGVYIGDHQVIMNANYKTGVIVCDISTGYYARNYMTARRMQ